MMWQVIKPHYWMLDRKIRSINRILVVLSIALLVRVIEWLYNHVLRDQLDHLSSDSGLAGTLLVGLVGAVLIMLLDINHILYQLFESAELEILMVNPVPRRVIYALKLVQSGRALMLPGIFLAAVLVLTGMERSAPLTFYLFALVALLGTLTIIAASILSLVLVVCRIMPPRRLRGGILIVFTMLPLVIVLIQADFSIWFSEQTRLHRILADLTLNPALLTCAIIPGAALTLLWSFQIFTRTFYEGHTNYQIIHPSTSYISVRPSRRWLVKEWKTLRRDTRLLISFCQPLSFSLILLLPWQRNGSIPAGFQPIVFWFLMIFACQLMVTVPFVAIALLAREGRSFGLIRTQPVEVSELLRVKFWVSWLPQTFIWLICVLVLSAIYHLPLWQIMTIWSISAIGLALALWLSLSLASMQVDFHARRVPRRTGLILLGLNSLWALSLLTLVAWMVWYVLPTSEASAVFAALHIHFSPELWLPLVIVHASLFVLTYGLWQRGVHCLNRWEISDSVPGI